jgi:hypothetical protein
MREVYLYTNKYNRIKESKMSNSKQIEAINTAIINQFDAFTEIPSGGHEDQKMIDMLCDETTLGVDQLYSVVCEKNIRHFSPFNIGIVLNTLVEYEMRDLHILREALMDYAFQNGYTMPGLDRLKTCHPQIFHYLTNKSCIGHTLGQIIRRGRRGGCDGNQEDIVLVWQMLLTEVILNVSGV